MLECPNCHGGLDWDISEQSGDRIEAAEACCHDCSAAYPVRDGIGVFLTGDLKRNDLWEQADTGLEQFLKQNPVLEQMLMDVPLETLSPVDQHYRGVILEDRGDADAAKAAFDIASKGLYSEETIRCMNSQLDYVIDKLSDTDGPVIDIASGKCALVRRILAELKNPVVVTDFSPSVLLKDRIWFKQNGLYDRVNLIAFDARRTPFKTCSISTMTTFTGLANIQEPGNLLEELRRIASDRFMAISTFYPEDDEVNRKVIQEAGLAQMFYRRTALEEFEKADWIIQVENTCVGEEHPAPPGVVIEGARVDVLPVQSTYLEWCVLMGTFSKHD
jgi:ubiquinone/menaquinone biosynthesis C-methylase UbiE/uncharacterized protein YbaR (Trm112 family)